MRVAASRPLPIFSCLTLSVCLFSRLNNSHLVVSSNFSKARLAFFVYWPFALILSVSLILVFCSLCSLESEHFLIGRYKYFYVGMYGSFTILPEIFFLSFHLPFELFMMF